MNDQFEILRDPRRCSELYFAIVGHEADTRPAVESVRSVDNEIVSALAAFGIPRGEINGITISDRLSAWIARKDPACTVYISRMQMRYFLNHGQTDVITSAWIHESIHARQPYADYGEYQKWTGYEEGLTEGLTQRLLQHYGIADGGPSFHYYIAGYEELASHLSVEIDELWRSLWRHPLGTVRQTFLDSINQLLIQSGRDTLTETAVRRLQLAADTLFSAQHQDDFPDRATITALLERTVR